MSLWKVFLLVVALAGACTKPNPQSCQDGTCTDPAFPFCDVDGALAGEDQTCIAVACTSNEFVACRGDRAITCNTTGTDYELELCSGGCSEAAGGCRLCEPNETVCANGRVQTCDANGAVVASEACALGCFEDEPRCRQLKPSNNLGAYLDMVADPPDLDLEAAEFHPETGVVRVGAQTVSIPSFEVQGTGNGVRVRVFVVNSLTLNSASVLIGGDSRLAPGAAIAIVARGNISITGEVLVAPRAGGAGLGCLPAGPGSARDAGSGRVLTTGGGGGANATHGAEGGAIVGDSVGGVKDVSSGTMALVPLRGGCAGGYYDSSPSVPFHNGGGAIQLSSGTTIEIDATIDVRGTVGEFDRFDQTNGFMVGGGGAGGSILLEAPSVKLGPNANLLALGGNGAQACTTTSTYCGAGGEGATPAASATKGMDVPTATGANLIISSGGGGGGLGRMRINTATGMYTKANTTVEAAAVTVGTVATR